MSFEQRPEERQPNFPHHVGHDRVLSLILIVAIDWAASINHQLVAQEQGINEKWAQVLNICQRRADLVAALVEKVKRGAIQEQAVAEDVTTARTRVSRPGMV